MNNNELLSLLKNFLNIEFNESDKRLEDIIKNSIIVMRERIGANIDFLKDLSARLFFLNYCKYVYFGEDQIFFENYKDEYLRLRSIYEAEDANAEDQA
ncbi:hypothetical protein [uncultured Clostridium sp.]|uniref:hypothetical protein n=1 Tax=uncultured Clostridium sp. TaxID=59620 RepID=UPI002604B93E|nr:hypothetical protein [uncultured Clostridium sp.]